MGMQKAGVLLGVHVENLTGHSNADTRARARRIMTPQREFVAAECVHLRVKGFLQTRLFTFTSSNPFDSRCSESIDRLRQCRSLILKGIPESVELGASISEPSRVSFTDPDGQGIWKEIHTDTPSTPGHSRLHSLSFETGHNILTPSAGVTPDHSGPFPKPSSNSPARPETYMEPPAVLMSPCSEGIGGRIAGSNYFISVPNTPGQRNFSISGRHGSPMAHSPQNVNIMSPQLRPLEKSPKLTQLHIASPRIAERAVATLSPDQQQTRPAYDLNDILPLPPASVVCPDPRQVPLSSPVHASTTVRMKKLMKSRGAEQSPRSSVSKDRSPGLNWKKSLRAVSPLASIKSTEARNVGRGLTRDVNNSFGQDSKGRGNAVNSSNLPSWRGCGDGDQADVGPALDRDMSQLDYSGDFEPPDPPQKVGGKKVASTQKSGTYNIFGFLSWVKKKNSSSAAQKLNESFQSDMGSAKPDTDSIKVLDYTIKTLRYKLEQANQKCAAAVDQVRALQATAEASNEKCRMLSQRCQDLELQLSARRSGLQWDLELEDDNPTYIVGRREPGLPQIARRFSPQVLTAEMFLKVFEDSQAYIRKLASAICHHIRDSGESATQVITSLLEQHKVGRWVSRMPRNVIILYFESFLNQVMFESFENVSFEPNGASSVFDPETLKQTCYQSYQNLKNQEWVTIEKSLGKPGALVVNASFHRFFVVRMELILSQLGKLAESEISLNLMASFFNTVKAVWLVHHLAFSFDRPVSIFRVSPSAEFDPRFMEQIPAFEEEPVRSKISIMVNPGFIVNRQTIKCQVYCSSTYQ